MTSRVWVAAALAGLSTSVAAGESWDTWPPSAYLLESLVQAVPTYLDQFHPETGKFGTEPWICRDQNLIFPLAAAWAIEDPANPWHHSDEVLGVIAKGGEALVDEMDETGKWIFRKKDNSTWGPIHMPWTYSRWIRAYALVRDTLPDASREKWEQGLLLGFTGIRKYADGGVHNIPAHHAMALYIAGDCFENEEWKAAATAYMARVVDEQNAGGYWSEHFGPVVGYNEVYIDALGTYYHFSKDPVVLEALERSARFHSSVLWPDGSSVPCIDERQVYHAGVDAGNVGFSWTPEGRGYLLKQVPAYSDNGAKLINADYAASMLLYGGSGESVVPASSGDEGTVLLGDNDAIIQRRKPWQWAFSGYACTPPDNRWIQDRQNLVDVYHDELGLVVGGGNTKIQPYWSTFTVGDPSLLRHTPGDESPDFTPEIELLWTPDAATLSNEGSSTAMDLRYGETDCRVEAAIRDDASLLLTYRAPAGRNVEGHVPLLYREEDLQTAGGDTVQLEDKEMVLEATAVGGHIVYGQLKVTMPAGTLLRWPARQHNPYKKDGSSSLGAAKLVLVLPFKEKDTYEVTLSYEPKASD